MLDAKRGFRISVLAMAVAMAVGCGGGGGGEDSAPAPQSLEVTAIDGYLSGAQVWLDVNGNKALDEGEPSAITDATGKAPLG